MKSVLDQSMREQKGWVGCVRGIYVIMKRRIESRHALSLRFVNKDIRVVQKDCFDCLQKKTVINRSRVEQWRVEPGSEMVRPL